MEIRRKSVVVLLGIVTAGIVGASAASLDITNTSLGADSVVVAACDTDGIAASFNSTYNATTQAYDVSGVTLSGVSEDCDGLNYEVTLDGTTIDGVDATGSVALTGVADGSGSFTVGFTGVTAQDVENLAVVISG